MKRKLLLFLTSLSLFLLLSCGLVACSQTPDSSDAPPTSLQTITGITFADATYDYDGTEKTLLINGQLPEGTSVSYTDNKGTNAGTYNAIAVISGQNYKTLTLTATLKINKINVTGVSFIDTTYDYDGTEKVLLIDGDLPEGTSINYTNNEGVNAGEHNATAVISGQNYHTLTLTATLKINKIDISGVSVLEEQSVKHDGEFHLPELLGNIPLGVNVKFFVGDQEYSQGFKTIGTYAVKIILSGANYNTLELDTSFKIKINLLGLAQTVISSFGSVPDPWTFLPETFNVENRAIDTIPTYEDFTSISSLPKNGIGKQLSVVYGVLNTTGVALSYVDDIYAVMNTIKNLYTAFLDNSPEDYKHFSSNAGPFSFEILIGETEYVLSANVGTVGVKLFANTQSSYYGARIQLSESNVLKYEVNDSSMKIAWTILNMHATQIEFVRNDDGNTLGYVYEYLIAGDKTLVASSTMIEVNDEYTTLIGTKGDKIPTAEFRNCEVYSNSNGHLVGTEVKEELTVSGLTALYNTIWFTIDDLNGIVNIRKVDEMSGTNADTIYINNSEEKLHTKLFGGLSSKMFSRKFDIEFKTMYFYTYDQEKMEYVETSCEVPMLFVQEECIGDLEKDFKNANNVNVTLTTSQKDLNAISYGYNDLLELYEIIKSSVTFESISNYCKN